ncbi:MAG: 50S ribosomal protein L11 methyltransferase [Cellulosilyticaceae bacterium]
MDYIQVAIETTTEAVEAISYFLVEENAGGVEICDPKDVMNQDRTQVLFDLIDESLMKDDGLDTVFVKAYFSTEIDIKEKIDAIQKHLKTVSEFLNIGSGAISLLDIPEEKWANEWKKYYKPVKLGKNILIKPTWETCEVKDELVIEMDPGMAFGTGTHETTALCAMLTEQYIKPEDTVLDIGTGSGILGIIAAKMGAKRVIGVDIDPVAVRVAKENVATNHVSDVMDVRAGNLLDVVSEKGNIVVSNIIADVIIILADQVDQVVAEDGVWIASGVINSRKADVMEAMARNGWVTVEVHEQKEWVAIVAKRG